MTNERIFTMSEVAKSSDEAAVKTVFASHEHSNSVVTAASSLDLATSDIVKIRSWVIMGSFLPVFA